MKKTKKIVEVVDDFDGTPADQTVRFAFNGASYEIDMSREHFEEFAEAIQPYIKACLLYTSAWCPTGVPGAGGPGRPRG